MAKLGRQMTYSRVVSTLALLLAVVALIWVIADDGGGSSTPPSAAVEAGRLRDGPTFEVGNPALTTVSEVGVYQVVGPALRAGQEGTYLATGAARVSDADASAGADTVVDCRLVRNPGGAFVDGRSVRLFDTGAAAQQLTIPMNGVVELAAGQRIDMSCAQGGATGDSEASVDSARLTYTRVAP